MIYNNKNFMFCWFSLAYPQRQKKLIMRVNFVRIFLTRIYLHYNYEAYYVRILRMFFIKNILKMCVCVCVMMQGKPINIALANSHIAPKFTQKISVFSYYHKKLVIIQNHNFQPSNIATQANLLLFSFIYYPISFLF